MPDIADTFTTNQVAIRMIQERPIVTDYPVNSPEAAIRMVNDLIKDWDRECFLIANLQNNLQVINLSLVSIGALNEAMAHPREIMKSAILSNASSMMLFHLHPSFLSAEQNKTISIQPSAEDIALTDRMQQIGSMLGIPLLDHIIISPNELYYSFHENQTLPVPKLHFEHDLDHYNFAEKAAESKAAEKKTPYKSNTSTLQKNIEETTKKLEEGIVNFMSSGNFQDYLKVMSRFHTYSYSNSILIALQRPTATLLQGYQGWKKNFNRQVRTGEKAIKIFAPAPVKSKREKEVLDPNTGQPVIGADGKPLTETVEVKIPHFKVVSVFDVGQTDGDPLPELDIKNLSADVADYEKLFEAIKRTAKVPIAFEDIQNGSNGYFHLTENRIAIKAGLSQAHTLKTAIHELTHSRLDKIDPTRTDAEKKDRSTKEVIAESCAFVVSEHFGLDTSDYSFGYVATWSANRELPELKASLQTIRNESAALINEIEAHLEEIELVQSLASEQELEGGIAPDPRSEIEILAAEIAAISREYDPYEYTDSVEDPESFAIEIAGYLKSGNTEELKSWLSSISEDQEEFTAEVTDLLTRIDALEQSKNMELSGPEITISFYVAECMEYPDLGELHENLSLDEALQIYDQIPAERMHGIKGIGFELKGAGDYEGKFPLMQGEKMQTALIQMVPFYRDNPLVQQAVTDLSQKMESRAMEPKSMNVVADAPNRYNSTQAKQPTSTKETPTQTGPVTSYKNIPVYKESLITARFKGESDLYRADFEATKLCATDFNKSYERAYSDRNVPQFLTDMTDKYGIDRVKAVLASTVQLSLKDGRYTEPIKKEALKVTIPDSHSNPDHDRRQSYRISCHPVTINVAFREVLKMEKAQEKESQAPKRTSILAKLKSNQATIAANSKKSPQVTHDKPQRS